MDSRVVSMAESAACRLAAVPAMSEVRVESCQVVDGRLVSAGELRADRRDALSVRQEGKISSVVPRVVHYLDGFAPQEWLLLGRDVIVVARKESLSGLVSAGAAKARVASAGSFARIPRALSLSKDAGAAHARASETQPLRSLVQDIRP